jgi:hypothetical protein
MSGASKPTNADRVSWKEWLAAVPVLGNCLRFGKRLLYLPCQLVYAKSEDMIARRRRNAVLDQIPTELAETRAEMRRLKHRYAEFYGAIVEQLKEQNRQLQQLAEQQQRILRILETTPEVLPLDSGAAHLPQAS